MPVHGLEFGPGVFGKRDAGFAFDGDFIVIINEDQTAKPQMSCQGNGFKRFLPLGADVEVVNG